MEGLPDEHDRRSNHRILEEQTKGEKDRSIAETGENGYTQIGGQMPQTGTVKDKGTARRAEMRVHQGEGSEHTKAKEEDSGNGSGDELAQYQQLATHGSKKVVVQAL